MLICYQDFFNDLRDLMCNVPSTHDLGGVAKSNEHNFFFNSGTHTLHFL